MNDQRPRRFPLYGALGLALIAAAQACAAYDHFNPGASAAAHRVSLHATAICWWGYILFVDAWIRRMKGESLLTTRRAEFAVMLPLSVLLWVLFEFYNFHLANWRYEGLSTLHWERVIGSTTAFATVLPGVLLTSEWLDAKGVFRNLKIEPLRVDGRLAFGLILFGTVCAVVPLMLPAAWAKYAFAPVWIAYAFMLDPINRSNGAPSLLSDFERGHLGKAASLFLAGLLCGVWWESWNWFAAAKWKYQAPFTPGISFFEMPMAGILGFAPFAWELYAMYHFALAVGRSSRREMDDEPS